MTDITEHLCCRNKTILADDLNAKHQVWNIKISYSSGLKLLELYVCSNFKITSPQLPAHYTPNGRGDVLGIVVHQKVRLSEVIITDILGSDRLPVMLTILDAVRARKAFDPVEVLTD